MKLLHIDSSISGGQSVSRQLTASIVARLKQTTPALEITYRDLAIAPVPHQSPTILFAKLKALYEAGALAGHIGEMVAPAARKTPKPSCFSTRSPWPAWSGSALRYTIALFPAS